MDQSASINTRITSLDDYLQIIREPCVIKFTASWCRPCKKLAPIYETLAAKNSGAVKFYEINIDDAKKIASYESIKSIPLVVFYNNGKNKNFELSGYEPTKLEENINAFAASLTKKSNSSTTKKSIIVEPETKTSVISPIKKTNDMNKPASKELIKKASSEKILSKKSSKTGLGKKSSGSLKKSGPVYKNNEDYSSESIEYDIKHEQEFKIGEKMPQVKNNKTGYEAFNLDDEIKKHS